MRFFITFSGTASFESSGDHGVEDFMVGEQGLTSRDQHPFQTSLPEASSLHTNS